MFLRLSEGAERSVPRAPGGAFPGGASARMIPPITSAREPNMTGVKYVISAVSFGKISAFVSASAVQPT